MIKTAFTVDASQSPADVYLARGQEVVLHRVITKADVETFTDLGYDRIRFIRPVDLGDRLPLRSVVRKADPSRRRCQSEFTIHGASGDLVCVGEHLLKWVS